MKKFERFNESISDDSKVRILAKFFSKSSRIEGDPELELLFSLDDYWEEIYKANRSKSFEEGRIIANMHVIKKVLEF